MVREKHSGNSGVSDRAVDGYAYLITCNLSGKVRKFYIPIRSIKNDDKVCRHCPHRKECPRKNDDATRIRFYDDLRKNNMKTPIIKIIL